MDNNHADALLNMELEKRLQERVRELMLNDHDLLMQVMYFVRAKLSDDRAFALTIQKTMASAIVSSNLY
jgi:hypothetical protein